MRIRSACAQFAAIVALGAPFIAQGQPVTSVSRDAGLAVSVIRAGTLGGPGGAPMVSIFGTPGSIYRLALENPFIGSPFVLDAPGLPFATVQGPLTLANPFLIPAAWVVDPTGAPLFVIPPTGVQGLNFTFTIPPGLVGIPLRFQAVVFAGAGIFLTNPQTRLVTPAMTTGTYADAVVTAPPTATERDVEQADVDSDGDLDALVINAGTAPLLRLQTGILYAAPVALPLPPGITPLTAEFADFDRDGNLDIAVGGASAGGGTPYLYFLRNTGAGAFALVPAASVALQNAGIVNGNDLETGDFDLDGDLDVILGCGLNPLTGQINRLFLNTSTTPSGGGGPPAISFVEATTPQMPLTRDDTEDVEVVDFDLDGDLDIVVGNFDGPAPATGIDFVYVNQGGAQGGVAGFFLNPTPNPIPPRNDETLDVVVADYTGDGLPDIYVANWLVTTQAAGGTVFGPAAQLDRLLLGTGAGTFVDSSTLLPDNPTYIGAPAFAVPAALGMDAEAIDYDEDGDVDVVIPLGSFGNPASGPPTPGLNRGLRFLRNNLTASGTFQNDAPIGVPLTFSATADYVDIEPGDWQNLFYPFFWSRLDEDFGCVAIDTGFFEVGKQP